jgi:hypothetical protein
MAETQSSYTPYHYCYNNPVNLVDPFGLWPHGDNVTYYGGPIGEVSCVYNTTTSQSYTEISDETLYEFENLVSNQHISSGGGYVGGGMWSDIREAYWAEMRAKQRAAETLKDLLSMSKYSDKLDRYKEAKEKMDYVNPEVAKIRLENIGPKYYVGYAPLVGDAQLIRYAQYIFHSAMAIAFVKYMQENPAFGPRTNWKQEIKEEFKESTKFDNEKLFNVGPKTPDWLQWIIWGTSGLGIGKMIWDNMAEPDIQQPPPLQPTTPEINPTPPKDNY